MKATELMIGDWVKLKTDDGTFIKVHISALSFEYIWGIIDDDEANDAIGYNFLEPIPLTAEILEKNGFLIIDNNASYKEAAEYYGKEAELNVYYDKLSGHLHIQRMVYYYIGREQQEDWCKLLHIHTLYVHEFQHALRLCGIKKDIEL